MGEHAEISYDRMAYGIRENKEDILKTLLNTDHICLRIYANSQ